MVSIVSREPITGHMHITYPALRKQIRQYRDVSRGRCRIGITDNVRRTAGEYDGRYRELALLYRTRSRGYIREIERRFLDQFWDLCDATIFKSGGVYGEPPYYCYVVWNPKRA